jgi:hypothetical protein
MSLKIQSFRLGDDAINDSMAHRIAQLPARLPHLLAEVVAKMRSKIAGQMPLGYEDETGFHAGVKKDKGSKRVF